MEFVAEATIRTQSGKGAARQIRRNGQIPAVLYGQGPSRLIQLDPKSIQHILATQAGSTGLISLTIQGDEQAPQRTAVIQDVQRDPLDGSLLHVDLLEVSMDKPVRVKVPVHMTGAVPIGVKRDKGVMHQSMRELHIECLPNVIPDQIDVDASALEINQGIHVQDLQVAEGIRILGRSRGHGRQRDRADFRGEIVRHADVGSGTGRRGSGTRACRRSTCGPGHTR